MRRAILVAVALCCFVVCGEARAPAFAEAPLAAETVCVKYGPCPLDVSRFTCTDTPRSTKLHPLPARQVAKAMYFRANLAADPSRNVKFLLR